MDAAAQMTSPTEEEEPIITVVTRFATRVHLRAWDEMTYVVMPRLRRLFAGFLFSKH